MLNIKDLYHADCKWYDYPAANGKHKNYKINSPKPFRVYHKDGTFSLAYTFGEYKYTFSIKERDEARAKYYEERKAISEKKALLAQFEKMDTEELKKLLKNS